MKAQLAAQIIATMNEDGLTMHAAERVTGFTAEALGRIHEIDLKGFSLDDLVQIVNRLAPDVDVALTFSRSRTRHVRPRNF